MALTIPTALWTGGSTPAPYQGTVSTITTLTEGERTTFVIIFISFISYWWVVKGYNPPGATRSTAGRELKTNGDTRTLTYPPGFNVQHIPSSPTTYEPD